MIDAILQKLDKVTRKGKDSYMACCPAHEDRTPSLALSELSDGRILIKCFAGCSTSEVLGSIGMSMSDLFPDGGLGEFKGWQQIQNQIDTSKKNKAEQGISHERAILEIAKSDRANGKRLSKSDLQREQQAYLRVRAHEQNYG